MCVGVSLDYFGKINSKAVVDAYFIILEEGNFKAEFDFLDSSNKLLMKKSVEFESNTTRKYTLVSFALNNDELAKFSNTSVVEVSVKK